MEISRRMRSMRHGNGSCVVEVVIDADVMIPFAAVWVCVHLKLETRLGAISNCIFIVAEVRCSRDNQQIVLFENSQNHNVGKKKISPSSVVKTAMSFSGGSIVTKQYSNV